MPLITTLGSASLKGYGFVVTLRAIGDLIIPGTLWSWGWAANLGKLGDGTNIDKSSPIQVPGVEWCSLANGTLHTLTLKCDNTLWVWGQNYRGGGGSGALGTNNVTQYSSPVQVPGTEWCSIAASDAMSFAIKTDGTLWSWGQNGAGGLGINNTICRCSPSQVPGVDWKQVGARVGGGIALKNDGTLWSWGGNYCGVLGDGTVINRSSPVQVPGTQWTEISAGAQHVNVLKSDGTLWAWGGGAIPSFAIRLGDNTAGTTRSSPIQIPGTWTCVNNGTFTSHALKSDGTLWAWGENRCGMLGDNTVIAANSPIQIPGTQWSQVSAGINRINECRVSTGAIKTDGTLWIWGDNTNGKLGDSTTIPKSSPVQIPGNQWIDIAGGATSSLARKCP